MEKRIRKTKCDSCCENFSYAKDKGYMIIFGNCNHSLCAECFGQATRTHGSVACFVKSCKKESPLSDLVKVNCVTRKISCVFCNETLDGWVSILDVHLFIQNAI
ncbi:uncharacterized protein LOC134244750 [Saccostrea cucullata]|uniref:uncharacterized protein LOC134244750 n=1 Tax=Saccostrea cuccullata TaxID=36930 RepID=UPI002ED3C89B